MLLTATISRIPDPTPSSSKPAITAVQTPVVEQAQLVGQVAGPPITSTRLSPAANPPAAANSPSPALRDRTVSHSTKGDDDLGLDFETALFRPKSKPAPGRAPASNSDAPRTSMQSSLRPAPSAPSDGPRETPHTDQHNRPENNGSPQSSSRKPSGPSDDALEPIQYQRTDMDARIDALFADQPGQPVRPSPEVPDSPFHAGRPDEDPDFSEPEDEDGTPIAAGPSPSGGNGSPVTNNSVTNNSRTTHSTTNSTTTTGGAAGTRPTAAAATGAVGGAASTRTIFKYEFIFPEPNGEKYELSSAKGATRAEWEKLRDSLIELQTNDPTRNILHAGVDARLNLCPDQDNPNDLYLHIDDKGTMRDILVGAASDLSENTFQDVYLNVYNHNRTDTEALTIGSLRHIIPSEAAYTSRSAPLSAGAPRGISNSVNGRRAHNCWANSLSQMILSDAMMKQWFSGVPAHWRHTNDAAHVDGLVDRDPSEAPYTNFLAQVADAERLNTYNALVAFRDLMTAYERAQTTNKREINFNSQELRIALSNLTHSIDQNAHHNEDPAEGLKILGTILPDGLKTRVREAGNYRRDLPLVELAFPRNNSRVASIQHMINDPDNVPDTFLREAPPFLWIQVDRFDYANNSKNMAPVQVDPRITIPHSIMHQGAEGPPQYAIDAFTVHTGQTLNTGHYISYRRVVENGRRVWYEINDHEVRQISIEEAKKASRNAYLCHYSKVAQLAAGADEDSDSEDSDSVARSRSSSSGSTSSDSSAASDTSDMSAMN